MGLGLFSNNRITRKNILEALSGFFDVGYKSLTQGLIETFEGKIEINEKQKSELMIVSMLAVSEATSKTWGKLGEEKEIVGRKAREVILKKYFSNTAELEQFEELFRDRLDEYLKIGFDPLQFGQVFCKHFFGEKEGGTPAVMFFIGTSHSNQMIEVKKFFDEVMAKCVFDW